MKQRILLFSDNDADTMIIHQSLRDGGFAIGARATSPDELYRLAAHGREDVIVVALARLHPGITETLGRIMHQHPLPVVVFVKQGDAHSAAAATRAGVSACVIDGLSEERIKPILTAAMIRFSDLQRLQQELTRMQTHLTERKHVERAKGLLMTQLQCSEDTAYTALRKMAMDRNLRIGEVAENIIAVSQLLN